jgi:hypothetical protein
VVSGDNWGTQVIQHAPTSASSGDGTTLNPLLVEVCPNIELDVLPQIGNVGQIYTLAVNGINNASPLWNTWVWQYSGKYVGINLNTNPTWFNGQTGGLTYAQPADDTVVRVVLINGSCNYYSNQSGYMPEIIGKTGSGISVTYVPYSYFEIDYTTQVHFAELNNHLGDSSMTGGINTAQFTSKNYAGAAFTADTLAGTITVNTDCFAKIHYTTSVDNAGAGSTSIEGRVIKSGTPIVNSITKSTLDVSDTKVLSKTFFIELLTSDVLSFEVEDFSALGIELNNTNFSVEYVIAI